MNIRHLALAAIMAAGLSAGSLVATSAQAMPLPGPMAPSHAIESPLQVEQVRLVCRNVRTRHGWRRHCVRTGPRHYHRPHHHRRHYHTHRRHHRR